MMAFVRFYEEPVLTRRFGDRYLAYRRAVPGWLPRLHPWTPDDDDRHDHHDHDDHGNRFEHCERNRS